MRPGPRADVGAPVAADLGLVVHAAERRRARTCRPSARATDSPSDVLPTPGGPTSARIAPAPRTPGVGHAALGAQLAHREVLDDAVLHVVEPGVVGVEDRAAPPTSSVVVGTRAPRQLEHGVEPRADPAVLGALLARALEPVDLALDRGRAPPRAGSRLHESAPELLDHVVVVTGRRRAPCGSRRAAGAAGTRAGSCPCRR